jgi:hypothetical protein
MNESEEKPHLLPEKVSKLEGAERILKTAIQLFFEGGDMLSAHALAAGAHEVLRTLLLKSGIAASLIKDNASIRPEKLKELIRHMNREQNFLKHADSDPDSILEYNEETTLFWIFDAIRMHAKLTGGYKLRAFIIFNFWFLLEYPSTTNEEEKLMALKSRFQHSRKDLGELIKNPEIPLTKFS